MSQALSVASAPEERNWSTDGVLRPRTSKRASRANRRHHASQVEAATSDAASRLRDLDQGQGASDTLVKAAVVACNKLIAVHARRGHLGCAESVLAEMQSIKLPLNLYTFNALIHAAARSNNTVAALRWLEALEAHSTVTADATSYNPILALHCKSGALADARVLFSSICDRGLADRVTYNTFLALLLAQGGDSLRMGIDLFNTMDPAVVAVDGTTVTLAMHLHLRLGQLADSLDLFANLVWYGLPPCPRTTDAAMRVWLAMRDPKQARTLFERLAHQHQLDDTTCTTLVATFGSDVGALANWLWAARRRAVPLTPCSIGFMLKAVINAQGSLVAEHFMANLSGGSRVVRAEPFGVDCVVMSILIQAISNEDESVAFVDDPGITGLHSQRGPRCRFWLRNMVSMGLEVDVIPLTSLMNAFGKDRDAPALMREFWAWRPVVEYDELVYNTALSWLSKMGCVRDVKAVLQAMPAHVPASRCLKTVRRQLPRRLQGQLRGQLRSVVPTSHQL